jgi:hypothetical protein
MRRLLLLLAGLSLIVSAQNFDPKLYSALEWRSIGPYRGGRTVGAAGIAGQPNVFFIGVNNGGVWKTDDAGRTWNPIFDDQPTGSIGRHRGSAVQPEYPLCGQRRGIAAARSFRGRRHVQIERRR